MVPSSTHEQEMTKQRQKLLNYGVADSESKIVKNSTFFFVPEARS
jgi:hypothetical protein